jgi:WD40 repeat protein
LTSGRDAAIKLWDASTGQVLLTIAADIPAYDLALSPDGTRVASIAADAIRIHVLPIEDLMALARSRVTRSWTPTECLEFLHLAACPGS